jgi:hypothetical protein
MTNAHRYLLECLTTGVRTRRRRLRGERLCNLTYKNSFVQFSEGNEGISGAGWDVTARV